MKKICFVTTLPSTIKSFLLDFSFYLVENADYDVTLIANSMESLEQYKSERIHCIEVPMKRGVSIDGIRAIIKMYFIFKKGEYDIVQYSTKNAGTYASIASKLAKVPCRLYCQWGMMFVALKGAKRALLKLDEKIICRCSSVIEVESYSVYNAAVKCGIYKPEKASVIWNGSACGVNLEKYNLSMREQWREEIRTKYKIPEDSVVFGWCGRITRDKGHNELLAAFKKINQENKTARLMMVGDYDNAASMNPDLLNWAQHCPEVIFTGYSNNVPQMYSAMDVFCSLSYREGFGLVVIEAAAMQLPCIVSDALGQIDTNDHMVTGITVKTMNVEEVVNAMRFFIKEKSRRIEMGIMARKEAVRKYDQKELFHCLAAHRNELIESIKNE